MAAKGSDRKGKNREVKSAAREPADALAAFALPDSLPSSAPALPGVARRAPRARWPRLLRDAERAARELERHARRAEPPRPRSPFLKTECEYMRSEVFVHLIPALEDTLTKARLWDALATQKCFFNGLDHIAQVLWNNNPRYPGRRELRLHLFNMPWARQLLQQNPRPFYPKSWLWPEPYAATLIQKTVRQYFVQREDDVQEMREFWKKIEIEKDIPDMELNPLLAKKFASTQNVHRN